MLQDYNNLPTITMGSSSNPQLEVCEFCPKRILTYLRFIDYPVCPECADKLKKRVKLILDFQ